MDVRKTPKDDICWGYYNCGILWGTQRTRKDAIDAVEYNTGEKWSICKSYMEVHKVIVSVVQK